jgi:hypothetical protein
LPFIAASAIAYQELGSGRYESAEPSLLAGDVE